jgi:hypothetical protein
MMNDAPAQEQTLAQTVIATLAEVQAPDGDNVACWIAANPKSRAVRWPCRLKHVTMLSLAACFSRRRL